MLFRSYCSEEGVLYSASRKKLVCFPASCEIKELSLPDGLAEIEDAAFTPAYFLERICIGQALADVPPSTLSSCLALTEITVDPANESLSSADGVLFEARS